MVVKRGEKSQLPKTKGGTDSRRGTNNNLHTTFSAEHFVLGFKILKLAKQICVSNCLKVSKMSACSETLFLSDAGGSSSRLLVAY